MINHLTDFLNKCVLAFKRDNHLETSSSVKQETQRHSALVFSVSRMASFSMITPYIRHTCTVHVFSKEPLLRIFILQITLCPNQLFEEHKVKLKQRTSLITCGSNDDS